MKYTCGKYTYGQQHITTRSWGEAAKLVIGSFCSISERVQIFLGGNHRTDWVTTYPFGHINKATFPYHGLGHPATNGDVVIGNDVWLGSGCTIMSGVTIGDGAVISANAHVVSNVEPYTVVGGNPAKPIKKRFTDQQIKQLLTYRWWDMTDTQINVLVPYLCSSDIDKAIEKMKELHDS